MNTKNLIDLLQKDLKITWVRDGWDFNKHPDCVLWTVGDAEITLKSGEQVPAIMTDFCGMKLESYPDGVHKELVAWTDKHGLVWEPYDSDTWLAYRRGK